MDEISSSSTPRSRLRSAGLVAAGLAVGLTLGVVGIAGAATDPPKPSAGATAAPQGPDHHRGGMPGKRGPGRGLGGAVRGELVVPDGKGGFRTVKVQRGDVTSASATSLTVKSADGVSQTYVLDAKTVVNGGRAKVADIKVGDKVGVVATGSTLTATHVRDVTRLPAEQRRPRTDRPDQGPGAVPGGYDDEMGVQPA